MYENTINLFLLGAGSSVDYGLPTWDKLASNLEQELIHDLDNAENCTINHQLVAKTTIEKALKLIKHVSSNTNETIDNAIFKIAREDKELKIDNFIFTKIEHKLLNDFRKFCNNNRPDPNNGNDPKRSCIHFEPNRNLQNSIPDFMFHSPENGWINKLNSKLLLGNKNNIYWNQSSELINSCYFVNFNYDHVLSRMLLCEIIPSIHGKSVLSMGNQSRMFVGHKPRSGNDLYSGGVENNINTHQFMHNFYKKNIIHPFGHITGLRFNCNMKRGEFHSSNYKTDNPSIFNSSLINCFSYEEQDISDHLKIKSMFQIRGVTSYNLNIHILGLGGGFELNTKLVFDAIKQNYYYHVNKIDTTCFDNKLKNKENAKNKMRKVMSDYFPTADINFMMIVAS